MQDAQVVPDQGRKLFFGLFIFPLIIAAAMAAFLCTVVLLTHEESGPESLIAAIKTGSPSKRWQKAFELSNELNRGRKDIREGAVRQEISHILLDPGHYDAKTRSYMAMALSHFDGPESVESLRTSLSDADADVQLYSLWSLGVLRADSAVSDILPFLASENADLRKTAAYVLGAIGDGRAVGPLEKKLDDPVSDVKWNAALSLARLGSDAGKDVLLGMLERERLRAQFSMSEDEIERVMVNAVRGLARLRDKNSFDAVSALSKSDKNLKVRQAAIEAVRYIKEAPRNG